MSNGIHSSDGDNYLPFTSVKNEKMLQITANLDGVLEQKLKDKIPPKCMFNSTFKETASLFIP